MQTDCSGNLPLVIGITGHRDIEKTSINELKNQLRASLIYWQEQVGYQTPIWLLSGLAEGADLLAIEVALELQASLKNIRIFGCLPMQEEQFLEDFPDQTARENYQLIANQLVQNGNKLFQVKHPLTEQEFETAIHDKEYGPLRNSLYLNQSLFVAKYSNVLIALWDGHASQGAGGSADAVQYKLSACPTWPEDIVINNNLRPISDFDGQVSGLVHHIELARESGQEKLKGLTQYQTLTPPAGKLYSSMNHKPSQQVLNTLVVDEYTTLSQEIKNYNLRASAQPIANTSEDVSDSELIFGKADQIALASQQKYRNLVKGFFAVVTPGFIAYELAGNYTEHNLGVYILLVVLFAIIASWALIRYAKKHDHKWKYQISRGIAETIRIRQFLNQADVAPNAEPLIPRRFRSSLVLMNQAIHITELEWWDVAFKTEPDTIKENWLNNQIGFLNSRLAMSASSVSEFLYKRPLYAAAKCNSLASYSFYLAIALGVVLLASMAGQFFAAINLLTPFHNELMYAIQYGLMLAGIVLLWSELAGYESTALGYRSLKELYDRAYVLVEQPSSHANKTMLQELAKEAVFEHVTWTRSEMTNDLKEK